MTISCFNGPLSFPSSLCWFATTREFGIRKSFENFEAPPLTSWVVVHCSLNKAKGGWDLGLLNFYLPLGLNRVSNAVAVRVVFCDGVN